MIISGVQTIVPYFYPIYLSLLLIIRAKQEDWKCKQKYGSAWDKYTEKVKYRILPWVY